MKVNISPENENSTKKKWIKEMTILFVSYQIAELSHYFADDIVWTLVGDKPIEGKENFTEALSQMSGDKATELNIHDIISHGKKAAIHGEMKMSDGTSYGFSDFYEFTNMGASLVQSITSYIIKL